MTEKKKVFLIVSGGVEKGISARTEERSANVRMLKRPTNLRRQNLLALFENKPSFITQIVIMFRRWLFIFEPVNITVKGRERKS